MENADYFQIDDTGARHAGKNHYLDVVCNDQFGSFFIGSSLYHVGKLNSSFPVLR